MSRAVVALLSAVSLASCGGSDRPAAPVPAPGPVPYVFPPAVVAGLVLEHLPTGPRPLPGLRFSVQTESSGDDFPIAVTSAADGTFRVPVPLGGAFRVVVPSDGGYHAPCPPWLDVLVEDASLDLHVVSASVLAGSGLPPSLPLSRNVVRGSVWDMYDWWEVSGPLAGATVEVAPRVDAPMRSSSVTDPDGRFVLCGRPAGAAAETTEWVRARKEGYESDVEEIRVGGPEYIELLLTPR